MNFDREPSPLELLRDLQEREKPQGPASYAEWRQEQLRKAPAFGGRQTSLAHYNPGVGMMGHLNTSSNAPTGPQRQGFGGSMPPGWKPGAEDLHRPKRPSRQPYDKPEQSANLRDWQSSFQPKPGATRKPGDNADPPSFGADPWFGTVPGQQFGVQAGVQGERPSRYRSDRPDQPPPWIDDVDLESIWYSPFQPVWPFGPPYYDRPRTWDYTVGYNLNYIPRRLELAGMLRGMRQGWGILATAVITRRDQLLRVPWNIQVRGKPTRSNKTVDALKNFFKRPDGVHTYSQWVSMILDDLFVIDAPSLYISRDNAGRLRDVEALDGATIFPLIDDAGRPPQSEWVRNDNGTITYLHRQPAYQQIIYGLPMVNLSDDELIYAMRNPRAELPVFGYSPIEQIMTEATEGIRKTFYQLEFWRSGSLPELIVSVPEAWSPRQIATFQAHFDALLSGQLSLKSKVRFLPGGSKPFDIKNASGQSLWSDRDEFLVRLVSFAFSISPSYFAKFFNRATAASSVQQAIEEGLYPLMGWWQDDVMNVIIQEKAGFDDIEMVFEPRPDPDNLKQAQIIDLKVKRGEISIDEARISGGLEPLPDGSGAKPMIYVGNSAFPVASLANGSAVMPTQRSEAKPEAKPASSAQGGSESPATNGPPSAKKSALPPRDVPNAPLADGAPTWHDVRAAAGHINADPSKPQRHAGNFQKGHIRIQGLEITLEDDKGSKRKRVTRDGHKYTVKLPCPYGYIRGFIGADNMHLDVYVGKYPGSQVVYVIDCDDVDENCRVEGFDEHKVMLGFRNVRRAMKAWLKTNLNAKYARAVCRAVVRLTMPEFKEWLKTGDLKKPISSQGVGEVVLRRGDLAKADTISTPTGLLWYDQTTAVPKRKRKRKKKPSDKEAFGGPPAAVSG